ncbi:MAG: 2-dehydropantoate 2-reductase [Proteobacteria bacterium]|nr:2-dehydropantoate 2-reductase [Burkholderiales bacterium]
MPTASPRIVFVGAGAIGGYTGAMMKSAGHDVTLIDGWPEHVETIRATGLAIDGMAPEESVTVRIDALHICDVPQLSKSRPIDIAFIALKSYDTEWAAHLIRPYLAADGFCVSLQNSINEERLAGVVGWGRTLGCCVSLLAAELDRAGHVQRNIHKGGEQHTVYRVGEIHGRITPRAETVAALLRAADSAKATTNLWGERWSKLIINVMRNGLSAATGLSGNQRDLAQTTRRISIKLGAEAVRVGQALGYAIQAQQGLEPETLARAGEGSGDALAEIEAVLIGLAQHRGEEQRPSMAQDMRKGRRTEIDYLNGLIVEQGAKAGVAAPVNARLTGLVKQVERGEVAPSPALVADWVVLS